MTTPTQPRADSTVRFSPVGSASLLFNFLFCMLMSSLLLSNPLMGGGLYLLTRSVIAYGHWLHPLTFHQLSNVQKRIAIIVTVCTFICALLLFAAVPMRLDSTVFWLIVTLVFLMTFRVLAARHAIERSVNREDKPVRAFRSLVIIQILMLIPPAAVIFLSTLPPESWTLLTGYIVGTVWECRELWQNRYLKYSPSDRDAEDAETLRSVNAYRTFSRMLFVLTAAIQSTLIMAYTFISCTADVMLLCMLIAVGATWGAFSLTGLLLKLADESRRDPSNVLFVGMLLWLAGLVYFSNNILNVSLTASYLSLALSCLGIGVASRMIVRMDGSIRNVITFSLGRQPSSAYDRYLRFLIDFASLCGQLLALLGLAVICYFNKNRFPGTIEELARSLKPLLLTPAMLLAFAAMICALLFPMTSLHMQKLDRYLELENQGVENIALRTQLENVIVRRSLKHYGVKIIMLLLRPPFYHRIRGRENVPANPDASMVFVCNHGEVYGPIVTNLYVPYSFRPWVIYEMTDKKAIAQRTADGTFSRWKWIPAAWRQPLGNLCAPLIAWIMRSVDSIPVYYQNPMKLRQTFRESINAMEAGDNILLFPENSDDTPDHHYMLEGVSHFFTGFTMLGPLYYSKTGKRAIFVPIYADRKKRVLTFGRPTVFNPDAPVNEERDRICEYLRAEMLRNS